jgi:O-glycosyl hydrolase
MARALRWACQIVDDLVHAETNAWFNLRPVSDTGHVPGDGLIVRDRGNPNRPYYVSRRFHVFRQFTSAGRPGSRRLETVVHGAELPVVAFRKGRTVAIVVANPGSAPVSVELDLGRRAGSLTARRTSPTQNFRALTAVTYRGSALRVELPPQSVTTYSLR